MKNVKKMGDMFRTLFDFDHVRARFAMLVFVIFQRAFAYKHGKISIEFGNCHSSMLAMYKIPKEAYNIWPCSLDQKGGNENYMALFFMPFWMMILINIIDELKLSSSTSLTSDARGTDHNGSSLAQG